MDVPSSSHVTHDNGVMAAPISYPQQPFEANVPQQRVLRHQVQGPYNSSDMYNSNGRMVQNSLSQRLMQRKHTKKLPKNGKCYKQSRNGSSAKVLELRKALDLSKYIKQVETLIMQPIKIPSTVSFGMNKRRKLPSKPKQDLLSVKDVWRDPEQRRSEMREFFNTKSLDSDREYLLNVLLDESDDESDSEQITDEDFAFMLEHRREAKKLMKAYHQDFLNAQYQYYSSGMLSEVDKHGEVKKKITDLYEDMIYD
ncbi:unnamed protein product [Bursaphelenchus okinawaensis]|uniref:Uncharacterized protein n=1 Tax=Bursaphelenchus okinawaensis TaxID=465554 RepID=A0A811LKN5_9BILA|nr:unnamed protein product [Bursaphelenchus okinawaensis]CAG9125622.1 unnamed protein product [Bursaphelenchus okinawaensis]